MGGRHTVWRRSGIVAGAWLGVVVGAATAANERATVVSSDPEAFDRFGAAVDMDGDLAIVGSPYDDLAGLSDAGSAVILQRASGDDWTAAATLVASDPGASARFGWSVAVSGRTAIVGAPTAAGFGSVTGAAYVFDRSPSGAWTQVARLEAGSFLGRSFFGVSVAIDGDRAVVGAHGGRGEAYVFHRNHNGPDAWGRVAKLTASDGGPGDRLGSAVAISGTTVVAAAGGAGAVYIFQDNAAASGWTEMARITGSSRTAGDGFGRDVALGGNVLLVGAPRSDDACPQDPHCNSGAAYFFRRHVGVPHRWGQIARITAAEPTAGDEFGVQVDLSGRLAAVGAWRCDDGAADAGAVFLFERMGSFRWRPVAKYTASDGEPFDELGRAVVVQGDTVLAGAWRHGGDLPMAGAVYVFGYCTGDVDGDGFVGMPDLLGVISAWGSAGGLADVDKDGVVAIADLLFVIALWGPCS